MPTENIVFRRGAEGESTVIAPQQLKTDHCSSENVTRRSVLRGAALGMAALAAGVDPLFCGAGVEASQHCLHHGR